MTITLASNWIISVLLVSTRFGVLFFATPLDGFGRVPARVKLLLCLGISMVLVTAMGSSVQTIPGTIFSLGMAVVNELLVGLVMAFGLYCVFGALMVGGRILDFQAGFGAANILNPATNTHSPLIGTVLTLLVVLLFYLSGAYLQLFRGLSYSLEVIPPGQGLATFSLAPIVAQFGIVFSYGAMLAAPVVAVLLLVDTGIGVMARSMPQMNVYFLFLPLKLFLALVLTGLSLRYMTPLLEQMFLDVFRYWIKVL